MGNILIVDDDTINQRVLRHILKKTSHSITAVSSGKEALQLLSQASFDLGIFDIAMPEIDGLTLFNQIQQSKSRGMRVIFLTASSSDEDRLRAISNGAAAFFTKPTSSVQILSTVEALMQPRPSQKP